jgi:hypothetical protein
LRHGEEGEGAAAGPARSAERPEVPGSAADSWVGAAGEVAAGVGLDSAPARAWGLRFLDFLLDTMTGRL